MKHDRWQRGHGELMKYTVFVFLFIQALEDASLSVWSSQPSWRINHPVRRRYQRFPQNPPASDPLKGLVPGSQRLVKSSFSKALKTRARIQTGALNFSSVTSRCQEQRTANAGKFYLLNVDTSLFRIAFQSKWDNDGLCRANSTSNPHQATVWESSAGRRISSRAWKCADKAPRVRETDEIIDFDLSSGKSHRTSMQSLSDLLRGEWEVLIFHGRCERCGVHNLFRPPYSSFRNLVMFQMFSFKLLLHWMLFQTIDLRRWNCYNNFAFNQISKCR